MTKLISSWQFLQANSRPVVPSGLPVFLFVGRLVTTKGVRVLIEAAKILRGQNRSFELLIIGDGPDRGALEQFAGDSQLGSLCHLPPPTLILKPAMKFKR